MNGPDDKQEIFDELSRHAPMDLVRRLLAQHAEVVRAEEGNRLTVGASTFEVLEYVDVDGDEERICYEVWVTRRGEDIGEPE
jgi:hypothetical protein